MSSLKVTEYLNLVRTQSLWEKKAFVQHFFQVCGPAEAFVGYPGHMFHRTEFSFG